ncbi:MAG: hypothetical protein EAX86_05265 [Candidatus Heimdallarchaeota archaeon]|nr:hypothetical protein [Candidatus Heimdallarchaeota archaeon]
MQTVAFHSYRGGVGKTLLSVNTAVQLAKFGKKVCLVDFDLRAPSLQSYITSESVFSLDQNDFVSFTEFLIGKGSPEEVINPTKLENFYVVVSDIEILQNKSQTRSKLTQHGEGRILAKLFEFIRYCNSQEFEFLIIDCMPGVTYRSLDALVVSDKIMIITRPVKSEITGLGLVISECYSKLDDTKFYAIMNQIETIQDLKNQPNQMDLKIAQDNLKGIASTLKNNNLEIDILHSFRRVPFVTERIYVLLEDPHPFTKEIQEFCQKLISL